MTLTPDGGRDDDRPDNSSSSDIDAEFARMIEGFDIPDDLSSLDDEGAAPPALAVVATAVASAKALAAALKLSGATKQGRGSAASEPDDADAAPIAGLPANARVLDTEMGAIVLAQTDQEGAQALAATVSRALQQLGVLLFFRARDQMTATRYKEGERGDDVPPAIVLGGMDRQLEQLMLGSIDASSFGDGIDPATITTFQALRWIASGRGKR